MNRLVGALAIIAFIVAVALMNIILGEIGFVLIGAAIILWLVAPGIGEEIIDWFEERRWQRRKKYPLPDAISMVTDHDLSIMEDLGIMPEEDK